MVQFWQNSMYDSAPKYPTWHPDSLQSRERKDDLHKCATNPKKLKLIRPLMKDLPPKPSPAEVSLEGDIRNVHSPTSASDAVSLMAASRFGLDSPLTSDHLVGLTHPEEFWTDDQNARFDAFAGPTQQTLYGWTSPAGPQYVAPESSTKTQRQQSEDERQ